MKFNQLYNAIFINEQEEEIASPENFNDVQPLPLPEPPVEGTEPTVPSVATGSTLNDFITQLEDFANKLNSTDATSLQSIVSNLDKVETPFEGIYSRTSAEIVDAAKTLRSVSEKLKNFIIHAAKK